MEKQTRKWVAWEVRYFLPTTYTPHEFEHSSVLHTLHTRKAAVSWIRHLRKKEQGMPAAGRRKFFLCKAEVKTKYTPIEKV